MEEARPKAVGRAWQLRAPGATGSQPTETPFTKKEIALDDATGSQPTKRGRVDDPAAGDDHAFEATVDQQCEAAAQKACVRYTQRVFQDTIRNIDILIGVNRHVCGSDTMHALECARTCVVNARELSKEGLGQSKAWQYTSAAVVVSCASTASGSGEQAHSQRQDGSDPVVLD